ncbi:pantothenate kinase [Leadbettera azotonutricia]|uniref:Type II pantothenate kinase (Pantothenic acid kinase)(PanK-II) n=1 Tax=Leadbettera azotonutricia (strain ATCC BAA-888 / DSM 13862 / ZAS-9) TaxID=545695 RepID=F5Y8P6_LEAAZ|nr:pantothenate kinase [Leadbettera azotonutricia]AEF80417.1 type II pantothenate kinase (Pantothenic acid kinase)(PanK-II) [Leadbettera azotonutricia ZAS-9]
MIIGIDIGSTTTKAVSIEAGKVLKMIKTTASDALTSATGAFGKMIVENNIRMPDIQGIRITGAGSTKINNDLFGIPTKRVEEITAIGIGGMFLSGQDNIVIANIGTGTAIIEAKKDKISHLGGSGVGGGTILGLAKKLLMMSGFSDVMELAKSGNLNQVDLLMEDIMETDISFLNKESTASNFGKMLDTARNEDIALGILNLVYQVIGMMSVFAARSRNIDQVIVTGSGSNNPIGKKILSEITKMHSVAFEYPPDAEYTTAIGAGLH